MRSLVSLQAVLTALVLAHSSRAAERLFTLSIETLGGYIHTTETPYFENEIILAEQIDWYKGIEVRAENKLFGEVGSREVEEDVEVVVGGEPETIRNDDEDGGVVLVDEITLEGRFRLLNFLWAGPALKFFFQEGVSVFGVEAIVALDITVGSTGTVLQDENKLRYDLSGNRILYRNEADVIQPFPLSSLTTLYLSVENNLTVSDETVNSLLAGLGLTVGPVSVYAKYAMGVTGEGRVLHGVEGGVVVEL